MPPPRKTWSPMQRADTQTISIDAPDLRGDRYLITDPRRVPALGGRVRPVGPVEGEDWVVDTGERRSACACASRTSSGPSTTCSPTRCRGRDRRVLAGRPERSRMRVHLHAVPRRGHPRARPRATRGGRRDRAADRARALERAAVPRRRRRDRSAVLTRRGPACPPAPARAAPLGPAAVRPGDARAAWHGASAWPQPPARDDAGAAHPATPSGPSRNDVTAGASAGDIEMS